MDVRVQYFESYCARKNDQIQNYESTYRYGDTSFQTSTSGWLAEAVRTGEVFPGRAEVRLRIFFRSSTREEKRSVVP